MQKSRNAYAIQISTALEFRQIGEHKNFDPLKTIRIELCHRSVNYFLYRFLAKFKTGFEPFFQTSPVTRSRLTSDDGLFVRPRIQHLKVVKRNLGLGEEMIYCPKCEYPATKMTDNKGIF